MQVKDFSNISPIDIRPSEMVNTIQIPKPTIEPTIGVIDTLFNNEVYFSEWVESINLLHPDIHTTNKDYEHGTAVCSIIVDGPAGNPDLEDGCGRFRVKHFGIATASGFSSFSILQQLESIIASNQDIKVWNLSLGSIKEIEESFISLEAAEIDRLQKKYDVILVIAGTNDSEFTQKKE